MNDVCEINFEFQKMLSARRQHFRMLHVAVGQKYLTSSKRHASTRRVLSLSRGAPLSEARAISRSTKEKILVVYVLRSVSAYRDHSPNLRSSTQHSDESTHMILKRMNNSCMLIRYCGYECVWRTTDSALLAGTQLSRSILLFHFCEWLCSYFVVCTPPFMSE